MNKICNKCGEEKPADDFYKRKGNKDGLQPTCKVCELRIKRQYYQDNPDKHWYRKRPEESLERARNYKKKNWEKMMWVSAKYNANKNGREFSIEEKDIIIPEYCPLLGIKLTKILSGGRVSSNPSLDRIDNSKGYIKGNVMVISDKANRLKMDLSLKELKQLAKNINKIYGKL